MSTPSKGKSFSSQKEADKGRQVKTTCISLPRLCAGTRGLNLLARGDEPIEDCVLDTY